MMTLDVFSGFLGWCSVINIGVLLLSTVLVTALKGPITRLHASDFWAKSGGFANKAL